MCFYPFYDPEPAPPKPPKVGTHWRKRGETLSWEVKESEDDRVILMGPGACKGHMFLDVKDFGKDWVRA